MKILRIVLIAAAAMVHQTATAQTPAPPAPTSAETPAVDSTSPPAAQQSPSVLSRPVVISLPGPIKIESTSSGGGGVGWLTAVLGLLGVAVTAAVSGWVGHKNVQAAAEQRVVAKEIALHDREAKIKLADDDLKARTDQFEKKLAEEQRQADQTAAGAQAAHAHTKSIERDRFDLELKRLGYQSGISDNEMRLAATKFVHEQQRAEAELVRSFADRLLGEKERDRSFALFALSAYVSADVIGRLAAAGEDIVPTASLEKLATIDGYEIAGVAKKIIERRKPPAKSETPASEERPAAQPIHAAQTRPRDPKGFYIPDTPPRSP
jgi:hypothetical protein